MGASDSLEQRKEAKRRWIDPREDGAKERGRVRDGTGAEARPQKNRRRAAAPFGETGERERGGSAARSRGETREKAGRNANAANGLLFSRDEMNDK